MRFDPTNRCRETEQISFEVLTDNVRLSSEVLGLSRQTVQQSGGVAFARRRVDLSSLERQLPIINMFDASCNTKARLI